MKNAKYAQIYHQVLSYSKATTLHKNLLLEWIGSLTGSFVGYIVFARILLAYCLWITFQRIGKNTSD